MTQCSLLQLAYSMLVGKSKHESECGEKKKEPGEEREKGRGEVFRQKEASKGGRGRRERTENWKDEVWTFFFPSLFPGLFTKFMGSCLISVENWERFSEAH